MIMALWAAASSATGPVDAISRHFSREVSNTYYIFGAIGIVLIVATWCIVVRFYNRRTEPEVPNEPGTLFTQLCDAHRLGPGQRQLLERLAAGVGAQPALLVAMPSVFDEATDKLTSASPDASVGEFSRATALRATLFDDEESDTEGDPSPAQRKPSPTAVDEGLDPA